MLNFKIFTELNRDLLEDFRKIENNSLFQVFQLPQWLEVIVNAQKNFKKIKIIIIYYNEKIILVAPLCINSFYGCKELRWLSSDIFDYNNPIISKIFDYENIDFQNLWKRIVEDLSRECDLIFFFKIPEFIQFKKNPLINLDYKSYQRSYQLILDNFDYDSFYNENNNNKTQQTDRRKEKKLNNPGDLKCFYIDINKSNFHLIEDLIYKKMFFYKKNKIKTFNDKDLINQYRQLINKMSNDFKFNLSILEKDGKKISTIFGVIFNEIYYYLVPFTPNTEFKKYSPGRFHIINLIKWAKNNNIKTIDYTAGDEIYKKNWSNHNFNMFFYIKLINLKGIPRFLFLKLYFRFRNNSFLKKVYQLIKYAI
jgi:CelD/BcsL family acetyltransferase involved in cellulose biosynthesis